MLTPSDSVAEKNLSHKIGTPSLILAYLWRLCRSPELLYLYQEEGTYLQLSLVLMYIPSTSGELLRRSVYLPSDTKKLDEGKYLLYPSLLAQLNDPWLDKNTLTGAIPSPLSTLTWIDVFLLSDERFDSPFAIFYLPTIGCRGPQQQQCLLQEYQ